MKRKSITKPLVVFAFFIFVSATGFTVDRAFGQSCGANADTEIVDSIYAKIKANAKLSVQAEHINITSTNQVVKIVGYADNKEDRAKVVQYAIETACVKMVNDKEFLDEKPSEEQLRTMCTSGTKPCGDICIPINDTCNISGGTKSGRE